jgi:hypothetical protein
VSGKIFLSYRRGDDPGFAGRLYDRLCASFKPDQIFMDIDNIPAGQDFARILQEQIDKCDVLLAVIGPNWLSTRYENGQRRLDDPNDFVRIEIESALRLNKRVVPVLVNNAEMPPREALPGGMTGLAYRNGVRLTHERFVADYQGLIKQITSALDEAEAVRAEKKLWDERKVAHLDAWSRGLIDGAVWVVVLALIFLAILLGVLGWGAYNLFVSSNPILQVLGLIGSLVWVIIALIGVNILRQLVGRRGTLTRGHGLAIGED